MADGLGQRRQEAKILAPTSVIIILGVPPASEPWSVTTASGMRVTMRLSEQSASLLEVIRRVFRFREVNLTPTKKASFGGYGIELDSALATVLGGREGQKISPSEMTKRIWAYVKHHNLGKKSS